MTRPPYILAHSLADAHAFAREELGLQKGHYRIVTSPSSISSVRNADLYLVPGWERRFDRFAMKSALRWTRLNKIDVAEMRAKAAEEQPPAPIPDGLTPLGEQLTIEDAHAFLAATGQPDEEIKILVGEESIVIERPDAPPAAPDADATVEPPAEEPEAPKTKRRRRRCKECGILVEPDEVESHAADHAADLASLGSKPETE